MISVIIPNYNHAPFLKERINSVLEQTYRDFEVILLDDCSTDNSCEIIESYRNNEKIVHIEYNQINSGSTFKQWEKGINLAKGDWIWIAESDDVALPYFLETCMIKIHLDKNIGCVFCNSDLIDSHSNIIRTLNPQIDTWIGGSCHGLDFVEKHMLFENNLPNASAVVFKKSLFNSANLDKFKINGDWLNWINIICKTDVGFIPDSLNKFREHASTVRTKQNRFGQNIVEYGWILQYVFKNIQLSPAVKDQLLNKYKNLWTKSNNISIKRNISIFNIGRSLQNYSNIRLFTYLLLIKKLKFSFL